MDAILESLKKVESRKILSKEDRPSRNEAEDAVRTLLKWIGEDIDREGLKDTPKRVAKADEEERIFLPGRLDQPSSCRVRGRTGL